MCAGQVDLPGFTVEGEAHLLLGWGSVEVVDDGDDRGHGWMMAYVTPCCQVFLSGLLPSLSLPRPIASAGSDDRVSLPMWSSYPRGLPINVVFAFRGRFLAPLRRCS